MVTRVWEQPSFRFDIFESPVGEADTLQEATPPQSQLDGIPEQVIPEEESRPLLSTETDHLTKQTAPVFRPRTQEDFAPSGAVSRVRANIAALTVLRTLEEEKRPATAEEQTVLAHYAGWGGASVGNIFDDSREDFLTERAQLRELLTEEEWTAARATVINANYTDASIVEAIWGVVQEAGFQQGRVLEPGCGTGHFIGFAPPGAHMVGVEIDPVSARIARALYPDASIRAESFGDTNLPTEYFDLVIGNVPFGDFPVYDPVWNPGNKMSIHNHFIVKSIGLTKPGGMVAVLTSSYTMDSLNTDTRERIADMADLVSAVRLPTGAHRTAGGTDVVTDLLVFQRRLEPEKDTEKEIVWSIEQNLPEWVKSDVVDIPNKEGALEQYQLNNYWASHPDNILGTTQITVGMHGVAGLEVVAKASEGSLSEQITMRVLDDFHRAADPVFAPAVEAENTEIIVADPSLLDGEIRWSKDQGFTQVRGGVMMELSVPQAQAVETKHLMELRDQLRTLIDAENSPTSDPGDLDEQRYQLKENWEKYVAKYEAITRVTISTKTITDKVTGEQETVEYAKVPPAVKRFLTDPIGARITGLEIYKQGWDKPRPAGILLNRQLTPRQEVEQVETPADGLAVVLAETGGRVDLERISELLSGQPKQDIIDALGDKIFHDPSTNEWATSAVYLSGNVRAKLDEARVMAAQNPQYSRNVSALEAVLPVDIPMGNIRPRLGAVWIPDTDVHDFMADVLGRAPDRCVQKGSASWDISVNSWLADRPESVSTWGTRQMPFHKIVKNICENKPIEVRDSYYEDGKKKQGGINTTETIAAQAKASEIEEKFAEWLWSSPDRAQRLTQEYNRRFNSKVARSYEVEGTQQTFPGLSDSFTPHPWQRTAVARILAEPSVGLFHEVGAGKTAEMIMGTMELKRLGLVNKPLVVVPNHMLLQFSSEWYRLYPQAKLFAADKADTDKHSRQAFISKAAMNDWDAIIITTTAFGLIPVSAETSANYEKVKIQEVDRFLDSLRASKNPDARRSIKDLEKQKATKLAKIQASLDTKSDNTLSFEQMGVDLLVVDEIHEFKNLQLNSAIPNIGGRSSQRATNLDMKLMWLCEQYGDQHTLIGASGTPISNSLQEMYVMQHYFRPDALEEAGVTDFDAWAATFAELVTKLELGNDSQKMTVKTRLARFINLPELVGMFHEFGDIKTAAELDLSRPSITINPETGAREPRMVVLERDDELAQYVDDLSDRLTKVKGSGGKKGQDNVLSIIGDGRHASLDMRLRNPNAHGGLKIDVAADILADTYQAHRNDQYLEEDGSVSPTPGSLQIVFCDLGVPKDEWNVYDGLKDALKARGVPSGMIRYIHEADNSTKKERLFEDCRAGNVAVIIGSTGKMGVGTNIQQRAVHLLHMDSPWKPGEVDQRNGRIIRQGNQNKEVDVTYLVVKKTYDALMWQTVERKAKFIHQLMDGSITDRVAEDVDDISENTALFGALKAAATDNPLLMKQAELTSDVARLTALERAHRRNIQGIQQTLVSDKAGLTHSTELLGSLTQAVSLTEPIGEEFEATVAVHNYLRSLDSDQYVRDSPSVDSRTKAANALQLFFGFGAVNSQHPITIMTHRGHGINATKVTTGYTKYGSPIHSTKLSLQEAPSVTRVIPNKPDGGISFTGMVTRIENMIDDLPNEQAKVEAKIAELQHRIRVNETINYGEFPQAQELSVARRALEDVNDQITQQNNQDQLPNPDVTYEQSSPPNRSVLLDVSDHDEYPWENQPHDPEIEI
ncbi:MAG: helicase [Propionibacteriaceae bacterium]|nr:helicase [Propionibacteriaceae bacterium]